MKKQTYHITTAIPYVNAKPHLGHVLEWFQADAIAEYHKLLGKEVSFTSGADENSLKNVQAAEKEGLETQAFLDKYSAIFEEAYEQFGISLTNFRRGSDQELHWPGVQQLWEKCYQAGDIYTKRYQGLYCVGCESFYTEADLIDGRCPEHANTEPELVEEENYFFKLSKYQEQIRSLIESDELLIVSDQFKNEMLGFIDQGLEDFSISRSQERARGVGVPVPNDPNQRMYVWFDALTIYMTSIGWGYDQDQWKKFWPADVHVIGKGINRFHSVYWIGMLLSAKLALPKAITVHGYITADGQKMSKSIGNVIDPYDVVEQYGLEAVRYYLLKYIPSHADGDFTHEKFKEVYTADLANAIGNVCSRIAALTAKQLESGNVLLKSELEKSIAEFTSRSNQKDTSDENKILFSADYQQHFTRFETSEALSLVIDQVNQLDKYLSDTKPWTLKDEAQQAELTEILTKAVTDVLIFAYHLLPFMPNTAQTIIEHFTALPITKLQPLFPRLE
jgi:methionyl-tRNA synthetase